jgi:amidohydrolase
VVGLLEGKEGGKTVAIRADMDALPLEEVSSKPYASKVKGRMHACGHDAHVTILLGVARFFSSIREELRGNIKWIFQPAEENGGGGQIMVEEGVLENPRVDAVFGAHVQPLIPAGQVGIFEREAYAAADHYTIRIIGKGGHGAHPHLCQDPILAASHVITQIHSIVSRDINPLDRAVVTIGRVSGGTAFNIIPDEVELLGTARSLNPSDRERLKTRIEEVIQGVTRSFGMDYRFDFVRGYPVLVNNPEMSQLVASAVTKGMGEEKVRFIRPTMGGEDFAFYLEKCPGCFFSLGVGNKEKGITYPSHSSRFDIDEDVLPFGVEVFVRIIDEYLGLNLAG